MSRAVVTSHANFIEEHRMTTAVLRGARSDKGPRRRVSRGFCQPEVDPDGGL